MTVPSDFLLVGVPSGFADRELFRRKLDLYAANLLECKVVALNDARGIVREYFGGRVIDSVAPAMHLREKRKLVLAAGWVVLLWDGTGISDFVYLSSLYGKKLKIIPVSTTRVVNKDRGDEYDVYIGRGTPWGNPFAIGEKGLDRNGVIAMYREYFQRKFVEDPEGRRAILSLKGKVLGCHCKPHLCHGDVIAEYLNRLEEQSVAERVDVHVIPQDGGWMVRKEDGDRANSVHPRRTDAMAQARAHGHHIEAESVLHEPGDDADSDGNTPHLKGR